MDSSIDPEGVVATVAQVIAERRSVRSFTDEVPTREALEQVLAAGLAAPYAAAMAPGSTLDRRFFVLPRGSAAAATARTAIQVHAAAALAGGALPAPLRARLEPVSQGRILGVGSAPCYVVIAERAAMMPAQQQSLAHALENMWLMATALGLGMHLVSATTTMSDDPVFCGLLGLPVGEYALNGCALGVPAQPSEARPSPDVGAATTWLD
ncbi:MAG TPA: nitroreductase family protein [Thermoleophilia bacterium]|nr:nitroreductase family protein [Thermoleophilia bacterium]